MKERSHKDILSRLKNNDQNPLKKVNFDHLSPACQTFIQNKVIRHPMKREEFDLYISGHQKEATRLWCQDHPDLLKDWVNEFKKISDFRLGQLSSPCQSFIENKMLQHDVKDEVSDLYTGGRKKEAVELWCKQNFSLVENLVEEFEKDTGIRFERLSTDCQNFIEFKMLRSAMKGEALELYSDGHKKAAVSLWCEEHPGLVRDWVNEFNSKSESGHEKTDERALLDDLSLDINEQLGKKNAPVDQKLLDELNRVIRDLKLNDSEKLNTIKEKVEEKNPENNFFSKLLDKIIEFLDDTFSCRKS